jgi:hypothetical protein
MAMGEKKRNKKKRREKIWERRGGSGTDTAVGVAPL